ncbi:hypothetical protein PISL3812_09738 [Talaromyces islandicus]|uniref:Carrier domain-containing protein n=1 Tax=Talaromyces islandicus TaxID=28573 RepID=A0A0U1MAM6_TALIS|nr:hypothetical protein PISL3812_09738 [Talaromyces islandicus]
MSASVETAWSQCLRIIAKETGFSIDDIDDEDEFTTDLGVNPIVARSIIRSFESVLKRDIPSTVFTQCPTIKEFRGGYFQSCIDSITEPKDDLAVKKAATAHGGNKKSTTNTTRTRARVPISIVLQGKPTMDCAEKTNIFLLPDGSGSGMAYVEMPLIDPSTVCLVALNSPYLNRASEYCCSIEEIAREYVQEIRKRQPHGPYVLGGWSAGGYYSYEVACELIRQGERVKKLILLDSPCRPDFEELPMEVVQYLSKKNLMGNWDRSARHTSVPSWVIEHFRSTLRAVREYVPVPMDAADAPDEVCIIWSREGVMPANQLRRTGLDLRVRVARFLLEGKPDLTSAYGWDRLFPGAHISISSISGNHFTLINKPNVSVCSFPE